METKEKRRTSPSAGRAGQKRPAAAAGQRKPTSARSSAANRPRTAEKPAQKPAASEIVYTQPRPFNRRQLLLQLSTVAAVVLALLFGMAIFFKVDESKIMVSGVNKYTEMQIREASGIRDGENLLLLSDAKVSASIISQLPYVKSVRVGIKLPDTVQIEIVELEDRTLRLKKALVPIKADYDFIFIDCPPSLGLITLNALAASDTLMVPIQCEYYALEGLSQLVATIRQVKRLYNPTLDLEGVLLTMFDGRLNLTVQVVAEVKKFFPQKVYKTTIPRNVRLSEAPSYGQPVIYFDRNSKGSLSYQALAEEFLSKNRG